MNIAFISIMAGQSWGGSELLWHKAVLEARKSGHLVCVFVYKWNPIPKPVKSLIDLGIRVHFIERFDPKGSFQKKLKIYIASRISGLNGEISKLKKFKPDLVLVNQGGSFDIALHHNYLYKYFRNENIRYALLCHSHSQFCDIPDKNVFPNARQVFKDAAKVFVISNTMKKHIERKLCMILENTALVRNPLNLAEIEKLEFPDQGIIQFAVVGALVNPKGQDVLIESLSNDIWKDRQWKLNIYGDGYGREYLKELTDYLGLGGKIIFHGHKTDVKGIWRDNHLCIVPSSSEGMPISLMESMVCGRPALAVPVGGIPELIDDMENGYLTNGPSASSISESLDRA